MLRAGPDLAASCSCPPRRKEATGCRAPLIAWWLVAPPSNEPSNPNRRDLTSTGGKALGGGWTPVDLQLHSCSWSSDHPASIPGLTPPFCGPEQLPQLDILLPGEGMFPGRIHGPSAVSARTGLWVNQGRIRIRALVGIFEMKQAAFLQNAKPGFPLGNPGPSPPEHLPRPRLVPGWSQSPHTPPSLAPEAPDA